MKLLTILIINIFVSYCISFPGAKKIDKEFQNEFECKIIFKNNGELHYHNPYSRNCKNKNLRMGYYHFRNKKDRNPYISLVSSDAGTFEFHLSDDFSELYVIDNLYSEKNLYKEATSE